jgi:hypothetical protein
MPRDFSIEELLNRHVPRPVLVRRVTGPDRTAGRAPHCTDWCKAIAGDDREPAPLRHSRGRRTVGWMPEGDDLLGWTTLLMTAPGFLAGALLALASVVH